MTKVQEATAHVQAIMEDLDALVKDAQIGLGRREMYRRLKEIVNKLHRLVKDLGNL